MVARSAETEARKADAEARKIESDLLTQQIRLRKTNGAGPS